MSKFNVAIWLLKHEIKDRTQKIRTLQYWIKKGEQPPINFEKDNAEIKQLKVAMEILKREMKE